MLWLSVLTSATENFRRIALESVGLTVLRSTEIFLFSHHLSNFFTPHSVALWCFSLEPLFAQFHPVARCPNPRAANFQPAHFLLDPQKGAFYRGQFVIWPRVLIIMFRNSLTPASKADCNQAEEYESDSDHSDVDTAGFD